MATMATKGRRPRSSSASRLHKLKEYFNQLPKKREKKKTTSTALRFENKVHGWLWIQKRIHSFQEAGEDTSFGGIGDQRFRFVLYTTYRSDGKDNDTSGGTLPDNAEENDAYFRAIPGTQIADLDPNTRIFTISVNLGGPFERAWRIKVNIWIEDNKRLMQVFMQCTQEDTVDRDINGIYLLDYVSNTFARDFFSEFYNGENSKSTTFPNANHESAEFCEFKFIKSTLLSHSFNTYVEQAFTAHPGGGEENNPRI